MKMFGGDVVGFGVAGDDPGGPCQMQGGARHACAGADDEFDGCGEDEIALETDGVLAGLEKALDFFGVPGLESVMAGDAGVEGTVTAQFQSPQQVIVSDEDETEGGAAGEIDAQQQAYFFQGAVAVVLRFVENDDGGGLAEFDEGVFEMHEGGAAGAAGFAQFSGEIGQESGVTEAGLGNGDGLILPGIELVAPVAQQVAFANTVGATEEHEAAQRGTLIEILVGLLKLWVVLLMGSRQAFTEGDAGGAPLVGVTVECSIGGRTLTSGTSGLFGGGCHGRGLV